MICKNCGLEVPDEARVCGYCGTRLKPLTDESSAPPFQTPTLKDDRDPTESQAPVKPAGKKKVWLWFVIGIPVIFLIMITLWIVFGRPKQLDEPEYLSPTEQPRADLADPSPQLTAISTQPAKPSPTTFADTIEINLEIENRYEGTLTGPSNTNTYYFSGVAGQKVWIDFYATDFYEDFMAYSFSLFQISPAGETDFINFSTENLFAELPETGIYAIIVSAPGIDQPLNYSLKVYDPTKTFQLGDDGAVEATLDDPAGNWHFFTATGGQKLLFLLEKDDFSEESYIGICNIDTPGVIQQEFYLLDDSPSFASRFLEIPVGGTYGVNYVYGGNANTVNEDYTLAILDLVAEGQIPHGERYFQDFENPRYLPSAFWKNEDTYTTTLEEGQLLIDLYEPQEMFSINLDELTEKSFMDLYNLGIGFDVTFLGEDDFWIGIGFTANGTYHQYWMTSEGRDTFSKWEGNEWVQIVPWQANDAIFTDNQPNHIEVNFTENTMGIWLNGSVAATLVELEGTFYGLKLQMWMDEGDYALAAFDNFVIFDL